MRTTSLLVFVLCSTLPALGQSNPAQNAGDFYIQFSFNASGQSGSVVVEGFNDGFHYTRFDAEGISGEVDGLAITGLLPEGTFPPECSNNCGYGHPQNDSIFYFDPNVPGITFGESGIFGTGVAFSLADGNALEFSNSGNSDTLLIDADLNAIDLGVLNGTFVPAPAPTPEPPSFALLGTGLFGVAGALRQRLAQRQIAR